MKNSIEKIINEQINAEFYAAYLYLAFSVLFASWNLKGAASWMHVQAQEERDHAMGFYQFLLDRNAKVELTAIDTPKPLPNDTLSIFEASLEHEKLVTSLIHKIYETAEKEKDYAVISFIKWYIDEQVEEEANATEIIEKLKLIGSTGPALYMLDQELATRTYVPSGPYAAKKAI